MKIIFAIITLVSFNCVFSEYIRTDFQNSGEDVIYSDSLLFETAEVSKLSCGIQCSTQPCCMAFTFNRIKEFNSQWNCRGHYSRRISQSVERPGTRTFIRNLPAILPKDCQDALLLGLRCRQMQTLKINDQYPLLEAPCADNWTVILRRQDNKVDFNRNWQDYDQGFGDLFASFWLGLENIHQLTTPQPYSLKVELGDWDDSRKYAQYNGFFLAPASDKFRLGYDSYSGGSAGDGLNLHKGMRFSTKDSDNDVRDSNNCAEVYVSAWWYRNCYSSSLCGEYKLSSNASWGSGLQWLTWKNEVYSLKFAQMMII